MSKTFKFNRDEQQSKQSGYSQTSKKAKLTKQQAGRVEKALLRSCGNTE